MAELRPLLAIIGLLVVAGGLFFWIARLRGWRFEWWERFQSPGRARGKRAAAKGASDARSASGAAGRADRPRASAPAGSGELEGAGADRPGAGPGPGRQTLIDLEFLPLLDPEDAVEAKPRETGLDREYDVGDLGSVETEGEDAIRPSRTRAEPSGSPRRKPERGPEPGRRAASKPRRTAAGEGARGAGAAEPGSGTPGEGRELLIVLTVLAPEGRDLAGPVIQEAFTAFGLVPDEQGMFHHYGNRGPSMRDPVFSVANVLDPGVFDLDAMDELTTPGLCLFLRRPGPLPAAVAFDLMLDVATRMSRALEAVLCDDQRCRLTVQATQALRERVAHFALRHERGGPDAR